MSVVTYAVTFGQKYNQEPHPVSPDITGQSYVVIQVEVDIPEEGFMTWSPLQVAHHEAMKLFNGQFAFLYEMDVDFMDQIDRYGLKEVKLDG